MFEDPVRPSAPDALTDQRLDRAIDRAVVEMLGVEPAAGLRARVLREIAQRPRRTGLAFGWSTGWLSVPIAAAAVVAVTVLAPWRLLAPANVGSKVPSRATLNPAPAAVPGATSPTPDTASASRASAAVASAARPFSPVATASASRPSSPIASASSTPRRLTGPRQAAAARPANREVAAAVALPEEPGGIEPMAALPPITIATIRPTQIAPAEIAIRSLPPVAEVHIAPLSPPDRR